jgi:hypothetical protein
MGETEVLGGKHYTASVVDEWMSMEQWWNYTDRGKLRYSEKNLSQCHSAHYKSHMHCPDIKSGPVWSEEPCNKQPDLELLRTVLHLHYNTHIATHREHRMLPLQSSTN